MKELKAIKVSEIKNARDKLKEVGTIFIDDYGDLSVVVGTQNTGWGLDSDVIIEYKWTKMYEYYEEGEKLIPQHKHLAEEMLSGDKTAIEEETNLSYLLDETVFIFTEQNKKTLKEIMGE